VLFRSSIQVIDREAGLLMDEPSVIAGAVPLRSRELDQRRPPGVRGSAVGIRDFADPGARR